jgi:CheY-like chemotaxis protein
MIDRAALINDRRDRRLVVAADDQPEILAFVRAVVEGAGYTVMAVASGPACVDLMFRVVPRLILLDIEMPGMSGFETCRKLRANPAAAPVPVAFLTGRKSFGDVTEGLASGGNDFILKPLRPALLLERVRHWTTRQIGG